MPKLPVVTAKKLIQLLLKADFYMHHQSGSHVSLRSTNKPHIRITIPMHNRDLAPKTLKSILVQAEITVQELIDLI